MKSGNNEPSKSTSWKVLETVLSHLKGGKIRDKNSEIVADIVSLQVLGRCFTFVTLRDQLVAQRKHLLRVEYNCCQK